MLFSVFGMNMAFTVTLATIKITYPQTETAHFTQCANVGFTARAPPMAMANAAITGGVTIV